MSRYETHLILKILEIWLGQKLYLLGYFWAFFGKISTPDNGHDLNLPFQEKSFWIANKLLYWHAKALHIYQFRVS